MLKNGIYALTIPAAITLLACAAMSQPPATPPATGPAASQPATAPAASDQPLFQIIRDGKVGFIDSRGKIVIRPLWLLPAHQWIDGYFEGLARFCVTGKCGFVDMHGVQVIEPKFEFADNFYEGLAAVQVDRRFGFIDHTGKIVIEPQFGSHWHFSDGRAPVWNGQKTGSPKFGLIDTKGNFVLTPVFDQILPFKEGLARCQRDGKCGYLDRGGLEAIKCQFEWASDFPRAWPSRRVTASADSSTARAPAGGFKYAGTAGFSEGLAWVMLDKQSGYVDKRGNWVIKLPPTATGWRRFSEGLAPVRINDKWGYIDRAGKIVIEPKWYDADPFNHGLAKVAVSMDPNGGILKAGYIDHSGKYVYEPSE